MPKAVAILEVMWDWGAKTSSAGYTEQAPSYFRINPRNLTGGRLYKWLGKQGQYFDDLLVTNACPELVSSAKGRGKPDHNWLQTNLDELWPFDLLLVCGNVAQHTYLKLSNRPACRTLFVPHPAYRMWSTKNLKIVERFVQLGSIDLELYHKQGKLLAKQLVH
jgi:hypothetical protein